jgi:hypothetical protein
MAEHVYSEAGIRGRREFTLNGRSLKIVGKPGFREFSQDFDLTDVLPHFQRVKCFEEGALRRGTVYLSVVAMVAMLLSRQTLIPGIAFGLLVLIVASPGFGVLYRFSRRIEVEQFRSRAGGVVVFDVIREKKKAAEFDSFVSVLRSAVLDAQPKMSPNQPLVPTPGGVISPEDVSGTGAAHRSTFDI